MIDVSTESVISLADAARMLPRRRAGKPVHVSCLYRWTTVGCRGVRLAYLQVGATRCTSREALARFFAALTAKAQGETPVPPPTTTNRRRSIEAAKKRLEAAGLLTNKDAPAVGALRRGAEIHTA